LLIFLLIHIILVLALGWLVLKIKGFRTQDLALWLIIAFFPLGGILICWMLVRYQIHADIQEPLENVKNYKEEAPFFELIEPLDITAETNIAPLEESS
jgi:H+/Cl- antiporter ClcA